MKPFAIVKFPDENDAVAVIRTNWITGEHCLWPNKNTKKALKNEDVPKPGNCKICKIVVLQYYDTYEEAKSQLQLATETSDLDNVDIPKSQAVVNQIPKTPPVPPTEGLFPRSIKLVSNEALLNQENVSTRFGSSGLATNGAVPSGSNGVVEETNEHPSEITDIKSRLDHLEELLYGVIEKLEALSQTAKEHGEMLNLISNQLVSLEALKSHPGPAVDSSDLLKNRFDLPLTSQIQLEDLNEYLISMEGKASLKLHLVGTGGSKLDDAVQRVMGKLLDDNLGVKYSFKGKRGKLNFSSYSGIVEGIEDVVRSFPSLGLLANSGQLDSKTFELAFGSYFKKVADRVSQRSKKAPAVAPSAVITD